MDVKGEVPTCPAYVVNRFSEFVELFPCELSSFPQLIKELIGDFTELVLVYPYAKGGSSSTVVLCFANHVEHPVHLEGFEPYPLVRGSLLHLDWDRYARDQFLGLLGKPKLIHHVIFFIGDLNHGY